MRPDMDKVIVERPRYGSRLKAGKKKGYAKYLRRTGAENLPRREPMLGRWRGMQRSLNEHLGPMRRFLRSRVGWPWNKVYQELCEHVSLDNAVRNHVLTHVFDYVHRRVELRGDRVVDTDAHWWRGRELRVGELYVCPRSGVLKAVRPAKRRGPPRRICVDERLNITSAEAWLGCLQCWGVGVQYHWRENAWWEVRVRKLPASSGDFWDVWLERPVAKLTALDCAAAYGGDVFATSKRPLSREEVRALYRRLRARRHAQR
jgi:hypothetical protein